MTTTWPVKVLSSKSINVLDVTPGTILDGLPIYNGDYVFLIEAAVPSVYQMVGGSLVNQIPAPSPSDEVVVQLGTHKDRRFTFVIGKGWAPEAAPTGGGGGGGGTGGNLTIGAGTNAVSSGLVSFSNAHGITFGMDTGGNISASYTVPPAPHSFGVSTRGNTAGNTGLSNNVDWVVAGSGAITASESTTAGGPNTLWLNAPAQSTVPAVQSLNASSGQMSVAAGNLVSLIQMSSTIQVGIVISSETATPKNVGSAGNAGTQSSYFALGDHIHAGVGAIGATNSGNTQGITGTKAGTWVFVPQNFLTINEATGTNGVNTFWLNAQQPCVANIGLNIIDGGNTTGDMGIYALEFRFGALGGITASHVADPDNPSSIWMVGPASSNLAKNVGSVTSAGSQSTNYALVDHVHAGIGAFGVSTDSNSSVSSGTNFGTWIVRASNRMSVRADVDTVGGLNTLWLNAPAQTVQSAIRGLGASNTGNTAGNTGISTAIDWVLAGSNIVTVSESTSAGGPNTLWINATTAAQTVQSAIKGFGVSTGGNTAGNTGLSTGVDWVVVGQGLVTASELTAGGGNPQTLQLVVAGVQSLNGSTAQLSVSAGNYMSISNNASTINIINLLSTSASCANVGSTSNAGAQASRFAPVDHIHAGVGAFGVSNTGTTLGNTGTSFGTWVLAASGGASASMSTGAAGVHTAWLSVPPNHSHGIGNGTAGGSTAGTTGQGTGNFLLVPGSNITMSQSSAAGGVTLTIFADDDTISEYNPFPMEIVTQTSQLGQNTLYFAPFDLPSPLSAYRINLFASVTYTMSGGASSGSGARTLSAALYTRGTGTNSTRVEQLWSQSCYMKLSASSNSNVSISYPVGISNSTAVSSSAYGVNNGTASNQLANSVAGNRVIPMAISSTLTAGRYWLAVAMSSASSNASYDLGVSMYGTQVNSNNAFAQMNVVSSATNAGFWGQIPGLGTYSATSGGFPANVPILSDTVRNQGSNFIPLFNFSAYTTGTGYL